MRLLGLTSFYPPLGYGYGAICRDVMRGLAHRGHDVTVLCAAGGDDEEEIRVAQDLVEVPAAWRRPLAGLRGERAGQAAVRRELNRGVDAAIAWHMRGIGKGTLTLLHRAGVPVVYALGDLWVVYERPGPPAAWRAWSALDRAAPYRALRTGAGALAGAATGVELRPAPIATEGRCTFSSAWLRERYAHAGFVPRHGTVIPNGIDLSEFPSPAPRDRAHRLLFLGRTDASKGADIAVAALADLPGATLTMAGGADPRSEAALRAQIVGLGLGEHVTLLGPQPRSAVLDLLREHDVFVMPGRVQEGFGLVYLEAMAAGLPVVGTATGGAAEFCRDGVNALVVAPEAADVATALRRVLADTTLCAQLISEGQRTAEAYSLETMVERFAALVPA